ncbi:MAG: carboxypeptidase regulatory-like domain-containing protein, partial [Bacteroidales bacterium]|nr:carboxypeptidase regulatory-like domain-containing protein [Bacteroidales bacterium]
GVNLVISANGDRILIEKYYYTIVYSNNGDVLFDITREIGAGATPAISDDGNIFVIGDYHGYATVYEYNSANQTYDDKWQYLFEGGTSYDWVYAIAVSGDGSTIALGSLRFEGGGVYSGELAVFDTESNEPLWIFQSVYDVVVAIDISQNGSVIVAASYGPLDDNDDDFWLFNKDSNEPVFAFTCQGSPYDIDLSNDASKCIVGGKAVHARITGHGGKLYYFDISQPISVSGTVTDAITNDPLEGAVITLGTSYTDTTNSLGFYNIEDVVAGTYTLTCELTGYETFTTEINVEGTEIIDIELKILSGIDNQFALQKNVAVTNYPNPFNSETTISYSIPLNNIVSIEIYDIQGKKIKTLVNGYQASGNHSVVWNGNDYNGKVVSSGIYYCCLRAGNSLITKKMIITQ